MGIWGGGVYGEQHHLKAKGGAPHTRGYIRPRSSGHVTHSWLSVLTSLFSPVSEIFGEASSSSGPPCWDVYFCRAWRSFGWCTQRTQGVSEGLCCEAAIFRNAVFSCHFNGYFRLPYIMIQYTRAAFCQAHFFIGQLWGKKYQSSHYLVKSVKTVQFRRKIN